MDKDKVLKELDEILTDGYVDLEIKRDPEGKTLNHLKWMINEMKTEDFSTEKYNRWLGYIQGVMVMKNITTLDKERERNR